MSVWGSGVGKIEKKWNVWVKTPETESELLYNTRLSHNDDTEEKNMISREESEMKRYKVQVKENATHEPGERCMQTMKQSQIPQGYT